MPVEIFEQAIQPIVDLDTDVVVYVPGYAIKGPAEPTLVTSSNFTALFGAEPYRFNENQTNCKIAKNRTYRGRPEKSWLFAKGLVDAGLTVLYHRCNPCNVGVAEITNQVHLYEGTRKDGIREGDKQYLADTGIYLAIKANYFGGYYNGMKVTFSRSQINPNGLTTITVWDNKGKQIEQAIVSFDPSKSNFIGNKTFSYITIVTRIDKAAPKEPTLPESPTKEQQEAYDKAKTQYDADLEAYNKQSYDDLDGFDALGLDEWYADEDNKKAEKALYPRFLVEAEGKARSTSLVPGDSATLTLDFDGEEFAVDAFESLLEGTLEIEGKKQDRPFLECEDTERFQTITYVTSGGYYQSDELAGTLQTLAAKINAIALIALPDEITVDTVEAIRTRLTGLSSAISEKAKSHMPVGADTFTIEGYRVVMPDVYGYLAKLGDNLSQGIPAWIPVANNPNGVVSAQATTRPISNALRSMMITNDGVSINPIIYKQNAGYTIMGNRTLFPTDGTPGPDSYLNCQLVVNSVCRSARRSANQLLIVSTNASTAFTKFKSAVSQTCDKMLVNGDGLASYNITKLKKTQPGTIDIMIELVVVEGIETFKIYVPYSLNMAA
ncbi:MAG: hypothetical protein NC218_02535 [Acetobacter sp.]|nr:hypothetical protein [Acetobacter sp.]